MFHELTNQPRPYQWGDSHSIAAWQGRPPSGGPEAELWVGAHPGSEASVHTTDGDGNPQALSSWLSDRGLMAKLPFLVKLLAAATPLSIQVHPTKEQAQHGFAAENATGIPVDDPRRNYRDDSDKPEILIAWSDEFLALAGLQSVDALAETMEEILAVVKDGALVEPATAALQGGPEAFGKWLFSSDETLEHMARALTTAWESGVAQATLEDGSDLLRVWDRVIAHYPGDRGVVAASFLNLVSLSRGEAIFLPAGVPHAYLQGFGLEVMAPSDNVLRGGLTPKHIDREELATILDARPYPNARHEPVTVGEGSRRFSPAGVRFNVHHAQGTGVGLSVPASGPVIVVVESGVFRTGLEDSVGAGSSELQGGKAYVGLVPEHGVTLEGSGSVFVVSS
jgi:mannose-6-phosphate isomerase